jgi:hypothetical protein
LSQIFILKKQKQRNAADIFPHWTIWCQNVRECHHNQHKFLPKNLWMLSVFELCFFRQ